MATKLENLELEVAHFRQFSKYLPGIKQCCEETIEHLLALGVLQVSTAFEQAIAKTAGTTVVSQDTADLSDGSDAKLSSVRTMSNGTCYSAPVCEIHGKTGALRVQVYERKQDKFYYFVIPNQSYSVIPKTSNIEIPFELDGTPRRVPAGRRKYANWWDFEVKSFKAMSKQAA